jgi:hypothetical protein
MLLCWVNPKKFILKKLPSKLGLTVAKQGFEPLPFSTTFPVLPRSLGGNDEHEYTYPLAARI